MFARFSGIGVGSPDMRAFPRETVVVETLDDLLRAHPSHPAGHSLPTATADDLQESEYDSDESEAVETDAEDEFEL